MIEHDQPIQTPEPGLIDRAAAEAMGYRCITTTEYAAARQDGELLVQLQREGLL